MADYSETIANLKSTAAKYGRIAKLTFDVNGKSEELKRTYVEIGKLCYEQTKDNPGEFFAPLFEQVEQLNAEICETREMISRIKAE